MDIGQSPPIEVRFQVSLSLRFMFQKFRVGVANVDQFFEAPTNFSLTFQVFPQTCFYKVLGRDEQLENRIGPSVLQMKQITILASVGVHQMQRWRTVAVAFGDDKASELSYPIHVSCQTFRESGFLQSCRAI